MSQLITKAYQNDSVSGLKARLANTQALRARNAANSADVSLFSLSASDELAFGTMISRFQTALVVSNTIGLKGRNAANSADLFIASINASDEILFGAQTSRFQAAAVLPNATFLKGRNAGNSADINILELNASNVAQLGVDLNFGGFLLLNAFNAIPAFKVKALVDTNIVVAIPGTSTFDGVTVASGKQIALTAQTDPKENGVWTFNGAASALTRPSGWTTGVTVVESTMIVTDFEGTTYGNQIWSIEDDSIVGTDNIDVHPMTGGGSGANTALSNLAAVAINTSLLPGVDNTINLGSATKTWAAAFVHLLQNADATTSVDVENRILYDSAGTAILAWDVGGSTLFDDAGVPVIQFGSTQRNLVDSTNNVIANFNTSGLFIFNADLDLQPAGAAASQVNFWNDAGTFKSVVVADGALAADTLFKLPPDNGTAGYNLQTDGSGVTSWVASAGSMTFNKELFTLSGTDITNQYTDLAHVAKTGSIHFGVVGLGPLFEDAALDYSVSYTGGAGGNTRITWLNDIATGGGSALIAGNIVQVVYAY